MFRKQEIIIKPRKKKKKRLRRILVFLLAGSLFFAISIYLFLSWMIKKEAEEIQKIKSKNEILKSQIKRYQSSDEAYEELLRTKLGYIRDGEKIIIYKENKESIKNNF